jgi:2-succinyl-6-hydroxy-2,4-cyclohexadiene-1-carboxylate synthase
VPDTGSSEKDGRSSLHREISGRGDPVVLIHGFTQSARSWGTLAGELARRHTVITVDAPGHGRSSAIAADLSCGADLMAEAVDSPAAWVGYSMGGRFALHVALRHPRRVRRLVVVSATGGIDDPAARAARREADETLAVKVEQEGVAAFVRWWLDRPLFATLPKSAAAMESRLGGTAAGLASSLRMAGTGSQEPLWPQLRQLRMPVLVVAGELDEAYLAEGRRLVETIGANATLSVVPDAGHACHLEQPAAFLRIVGPFLQGH